MYFRKEMKDITWKLSKMLKIMMDWFLLMLYGISKLSIVQEIKIFINSQILHIYPYMKDIERAVCMRVCLALFWIQHKTLSMYSNQFFGFSALSVKMLLVRIVKNNKILGHFQLSFARRVRKRIRIGPCRIRAPHRD